ncbi:MAG: orotidine-5'-phosphate decarboxylase [Candidatus Sumerlaeia bacterium]
MCAESATFFERLAARCEAVGSSLCVGIDPDPRRIPKHLGSGPDAIYRWCAEIIEATADYAAAFKPNLAFFESIGIEGMNVLSQALAHVPKGIPVILDAKRGDIGSTAEHYARAIFDTLNGDAITVNPYMGFESVEPFLKYENKGVYLLCLTSNAGAADFQLQNDLYLRVARKATEWNTRGNIGMVVGATRPQFLTAILAVAPDLPMLVPGLGAQGGDLEQIMSAVPRMAPHRLLFNVSRSIIYAADDEGFGRAARLAAKYYHGKINAAREAS